MAASGQEAVRDAEAALDDLPLGDPLRDHLQPILELAGRALQDQEREARPAELKRPTLPSRKNLVKSLKDTNELKPKRARAFDAVQAAMREAWPALTSSQRSQRLRADDGKRAAEVEARRRARSEKPPAWDQLESVALCGFFGDIFEALRRNRRI